jgi:hypothetical protein
MNWRVILIVLGAIYIFAPKLFYRGRRDIYKSSSSVKRRAKKYGSKLYSYSSRKYDDSREWIRTQRIKNKPFNKK